MILCDLSVLHVVGGNGLPPRVGLGSLGSGVTCRLGSSPFFRKTVSGPWGSHCGTDIDCPAQELSLYHGGFLSRICPPRAGTPSGSSAGPTSTEGQAQDGHPECTHCRGPRAGSGCTVPQPARRSAQRGEPDHWPHLSLLVHRMGVTIAPHLLRKLLNG